MIQHNRQKISSVEIVGLLLLGCALVMRVVWYFSTHYVVDDAYITFRFAAQLASGNGFAFNTGEHIYGTTTPFFALLLAGWHLLTQADIPTGATIINLTASLATLIFVWRTLRNLGCSAAQQLYVIGLLAFCYRAIIAETKGMETAWVVCFMAASWWAATSRRAMLAGLFCGLLLWTRPDTFLWIFALTLVTSRSGLRPTVKTLLACVLTYLPWLLFASWYFGSPIPHTITAKWVAYVQFNNSSIVDQALLILYSLAPFSLPIDFLRINLMSWLTILICIWQSLRNLRNTWFNVLPVFVVLDAARLAITKATFFPHYIYPVLWATFIILGLGLGALHNTLWLKRRNFAVVFYLIPVVIFVMNAMKLSENIHLARGEQSIWHEAALTEMGLWLNQHTAPNATVLLEPLGYVGYHANRKIIDEVGLISPGIVEMKRNRVNDVYAYVLHYHPDYVITPCNEAAVWVERSTRGEITFASNFSLAATFQPDSLEPNQPTNICYQIWQKTNVEEQ